MHHPSPSSRPITTTPPPRRSPSAGARQRSAPARPARCCGRSAGAAASVARRGSMLEGKKTTVQTYGETHGKLGKTDGKTYGKVRKGEEPMDNLWMENLWENDGKTIRKLCWGHLLKAKSRKHCGKSWVRYIIREHYGKNTEHREESWTIWSNFKHTDKTLDKV